MHASPNNVSSYDFHFMPPWWQSKLSGGSVSWFCSSYVNGSIEGKL